MIRLFRLPHPAGGWHGGWRSCAVGRPARSRQSAHRAKAGRRTETVPAAVERTLHAGESAVAAEPTEPKIRTEITVSEIAPEPTAATTESASAKAAATEPADAPEAAAKGRRGELAVLRQKGIIHDEIAVGAAESV